MRQADWVEQFKQAMKLPDPNAVSQALLELARVAKESSAVTVNEWHEQQALGTAGMVLEEAGRLDEALPLYQKTLELTQNWATYWTKAATHLWAVIALLHFQKGRADEGRSAAHEALRFLGREPESDAVLTRLMRELHAVERPPKPGTSE